MSEREDHEFMARGVQYYVAARYTAWAGLWVCGNLYHHSLEMFLKAGLSRKRSLKTLKRQFQHRLTDIWNAFKADFPSPKLVEFDQTITDLADFEEIRYPDTVLKHGMVLNIDFHGQVPRGTSSRSEPEYRLDYYDVDRLIGAIFDVSNVNPAFYLARLKSHVRGMLADRNPVAAQLFPDGGNMST